MAEKYVKLYNEIKNIKSTPTMKITTKYSGNFNDEYIMITFKLPKPKSAEETLINYFINFIEPNIHITIWRRPFINEHGVYHIVSGTAYDNEKREKFGVFKSWFSLENERTKYPNERTLAIKQIGDKPISFQKNYYETLYFDYERQFKDKFIKFVNKINRA